MKSLISSRTYPYIVCLVSGLFILYKYLLQISPSVMTNDLMRVFHLSGGGLGNLAACFFYSYLLMQIPSGLILDRYSPKRVMVSMIVLGALFTGWFAWASSAMTAGIARAGIGF